MSGTLCVYPLKQYYLATRMTQLLGLPSIPVFDADTDPASLGPRWQVWRDRFDIYVAAMGVKADPQKRALLLHLAGESVQTIFKGLPDTGESFDAACTALNTYFLPKKNVRFERYVFKQAAQEAGESLDQFASRLRHLALTCEFDNIDEAIADQVIEKCRSTRLKRRILRDSESTLTKILDEGRAMERAETQVQKMQASSSEQPLSANTVSRKQSHVDHPSKKLNSSKSQSKQCFNCGGRFPHKNECPAKGKACNNCGKQNHFGRVCRQAKQNSKAVNQVSPPVADTPDLPSSSDDEWTFTINTLSSKNKQPRIEVAVANVPLPFLLDSGASVNLIDREAFNTIVAQNKNVHLEEDKAHIFPYGVFGSPRQSRHSLGLETITEPTEQTTYQEELEAVPKCWNPRCSRPGLNAYYKLCMECYREMLQRDLDRNPPLPAAMLFPSRPTRTVKAPKAEHCLNSDCNRYGDPNLHGYCSQCLPLGLRAPPAAPSEGHYIDAITEIEKATKSGQRSCKTRGCRNYGNPRCAGYCHDCFPQQLFFS